MSDKPSYHKGDVKQNAVNIAYDIVQKQGGKKLTMRFLATELGISHTALYRHYKNKDAVLLQVATKGYTALMLKMATSLKRPEHSVEQQLCDAALAYVNFAKYQPSIYGLMNGDFAQGDAVNADFAKLAKQMYEVLKIVILKGQSEAVFKADDAEKLAFSLWSFLHGYVELSLRNDAGVEAEDAIKLIVSALKN
ncbi:MAG: TetR/AcrR family transcriptional regulator [Rhizobiales bacterium]|nr:TetR/AcrR family transcriptional regulator [Hyphomicrobiales bacterium]NRB14452.1 TetR/AcrR family transcriptional regulator [Hyphomicrobiales bacterium]